MKSKYIVLFLSTALLPLSGCVVTQYQKSISVTKDASGNVVSTVETESVVQPNQQGWPMKFEYLKGIQTSESKK